MRGHIRWLIVILLLTAFAVWVSLPNTLISNVSDSCYGTEENPVKPDQGIHFDFDDDCDVDIGLNVKQVFGLDIIGGLRVLLQADLPAGSYTIEDLQNASNNVNKRVNSLGVGEATVQVQGSNRILVELPGVTDPQQAVDLIQKTALLEFVDFSGITNVSQYVGRKILTDEQVKSEQARQEALAESSPAADATAEATAEATPDAAVPAATPVEEPGVPNPLTGQPFHTVMTGAGLQSAAAQLDQSNQWAIRFELTSDGGAVFGPFTGGAIGQPMAIVLDGIVLSAPTIQARLDTGGTITGNFDQEEAQTLALQLRSGSLPIPLRVISSQTVGATLGQESVNMSIHAGVVGVVIILAFMLINYRVPGLAASLALLVFIVLNLAMFKIIPITLTLPAIVGFLISIGTAVDGNILIFERMREELRAGKDVDTAVDEGFTRAWTSIRDSNISTILISAILFLFGQTPGASVVSGFAVTLALGLMLNLFTAVIATRTFLHLILAATRNAVKERHWLMGV
ncbi:MAG: protein translocase subunit SecD [Chloroflexi bacterium]|nr:protein translocase subunit SecD [Chloroflexota bacterium]MCC6893494.1 protein translocase subunit SecD [Anaerolineae bacterium]